MTAAIAPCDLHLHSHGSYEAIAPLEAHFRLARVGAGGVH